MSIESLRKAYDGEGQLSKCEISSNWVVMAVADMIQKYLSNPSVTPDVNLQPMHDLIYFIDYNKDDREQVLLRYNNNFFSLLTTIYKIIHSDSLNPYALLISAFISCYGLDVDDDDEKFRANLEKALISSLVDLIEMVKENRDSGAADDSEFADLFGAVMNNIPSSSLATEFLPVVLSKND